MPSTFNNYYYLNMSFKTVPLNKEMAKPAKPSRAGRTKAKMLVKGNMKGAPNPANYILEAKLCPIDIWDHFSQAQVTPLKFFRKFHDMETLLKNWLDGFC